ncbi:hypothetical protein [Actinomadura sp. GTD37]|uniref:hypothetical protein n=1 Tax=Actinomadura sp. GTD37 TaxID=1778030 RepID=UPI0035BF8A58
MSEYQYYEFLAVDQPLDEEQQAEVRALWDDAALLRRPPVRHQLGHPPGDAPPPRSLLPLKAAERYCIDPYVTAEVSGKHLILDLTTEDEGGD